MLNTKPTRSIYSWKRDPLFWAYSILMFLPIIVAFFFYNYYNLDYLVHTGWMILVFSIALILLAGAEFRKKGAPIGRSVVNTTVLVDTGVYAIIRHPQYLGFLLFVLGLVLMSQHWISVFSYIIGSIMFYKDVLREERMNIEKFGDDYIRYMKMVPRMNIIRGIIRILQRKS